MDKKKARSVRIHEFGGLEGLRIEDVLVTAPSKDPKVVSLLYAAEFPRMPDGNRVSFVPGQASDGLDSEICCGGAKPWTTIWKSWPLQRLKRDARLSFACPRRSQHTMTLKNFLACWRTSCIE